MTNTPVPQEPVETGGELQQLKQLWQSYGVPLLTGAAVVVVAVGGFSYFVRHRRAQSEEGMTALFRAQSSDELQSLAEQFTGTAAGPLALLRLASARYAEGNHQEALVQYESFLERYPEHVLVSAATLGRAHSLEASAQLEAALAAYAEFGSRQPDSFLATEAFLGEARCLELMGRWEDARVKYEDFLAKHSEADATDDTVVRVEGALRKVNRMIRWREDGGGPPAPAAVVRPPESGADLLQTFFTNALAAPAADTSSPDSQPDTNRLETPQTPAADAPSLP